MGEESTADKRVFLEFPYAQSPKKSKHRGEPEIVIGKIIKELHLEILCLPPLSV